MRKVDFFIIGLQKTGTTALNSMLDQHPNIFMCKPKESHHFNTDHHKQAIKQNITDNKGNPLYKYTKLEDYQNTFKKAKDHQLIGDCSPSYIDSYVASNNIYKYNKKASIIFLRRDKVDYIRSLIKMYDEKEQWNKLPFILKDIQYRLDFEERLQDYVKLFNVLIIDYEDFKKDNQKICSKIFKFLSIPNYKVKIKKLNTTNIKFLIKLRSFISRTKIFIQRAGTYFTIPITILNFSMIVILFLKDRGTNISITYVFIPLILTFILVGYLDYKFKFFSEEIAFNQKQSVLYNNLKKDIEEIKNKL